MPSPSDPTAPGFRFDAPPSLPQPSSTPPSWDPAVTQQIRDGEHLRLLSIFHYICGGLSILISSFAILYVVFGAMLLNNARPHRPTPTPAGIVGAPSPAHTPALGNTTYEGGSPASIRYLIIGIGALTVIIGWTVGALLIYSGRCLARGTRRVFSMVVAGITCLQVPTGTLLGVFTLVVLSRPSVQARYAANEPG